MKGANKLINDTSYKEFVDEYNKYMSLVSDKSASIIHYLNQAIIANLIMKLNTDYIIDNGHIKVLKNGRIMEGSTYSNGLHQAIEAKEKIRMEDRTPDTISSSTVTQKDFYQRYDLFSGMTGTSSESIFKEIFAKQTVFIPKHAFYSYYSKRKVVGAKEPIGVEKKDIKFALSVDEKLHLIMNSVLESLNNNPKQPILLVVSDYNEIKMLATLLKEKGISFSVLDATTSKEDEALIIARAGIPGAVTISTEMAGRGTDIKIGGDRDTIIDIATSRHIRNLEKKQKQVLNFSQIEKEYLRKKVTTALENSPSIRLWSSKDEDEIRNKLETIGLKVISSGFFKVDRIDRQLEGRTGRNGISGVCERFACPDDLKRIGLSSINMKDSIIDYLGRFKKKVDGSLDIDDPSYKTIAERITFMQNNNEGYIRETIKNTQKVDEYATSLVERYRDQRRKVLCESLNMFELVDNMIERSTDGILASYVLSKEINQDILLEPLNKKEIDINIELICLEIKQTLGITIDPSVIEKSNINFIEFRDAIVRTAKERLKEFNIDDLKRMLLIQNDYMISNVPELLEHSLSVRNLTSLALGQEEKVNYNAEMDFDNSRKKLSIESCKQGLKKVMGIPFSIDEFKEFEKRRKNLFEYVVKKSNDELVSYEVSEPVHEENPLGLLDKMNSIRDKVQRRNRSKIENIERKSHSYTMEEINGLYSNLEVRPMKFIKAMTGNGKVYNKLVIVRNPKKINEEAAIK